MSRIGISLLGPVTATVDDKPITHFTYAKVAALLAYLASEHGAHARDELTDLLWPDAEARNARQSLSQALSTLRTLLGDRETAEGVEPLIEASRQSVGLSAAADVRLDTEAFERHSLAAHEHQHDDPALCGPCLEHLVRGIELYRGDFLADLSLPDALRFEEWALLRREQLRRRCLEDLGLLTGAHLALKHYADARRTARRQLTLDPWRESAHRQLMRALALDGRRTTALGQYATCRETLAAELGVDPEPATTALYEAIRDGTLRTEGGPLDLPPGTPPVQGAGPAPFRGLRYFDVADADLYFGREALTERLVKHVASGAPFLAVIGASGSGKSSLVRAGLIARVQQMAAEAGRSVRVVVLTPTAQPLLSLCRAALAEGAPEGDTVACSQALRGNPAGLRSRLVETATLNAAAGAHTLLVVDQFEELFSLCRDFDDRRLFVDSLVAAAGTRSRGGSVSSVQVVITLRADFYHHCADYEALREVLGSHQTYIGAMVPEELKRAIEGPAAAGGWALEPGLVDLLLQDVGASAGRAPEPGALPLLSHALLETWKRREGRTLTLKGYADAGGVRGAIAQSAESVYRALDPDERRIARSVFLRLTELAEADGETGTSLFTRRRAGMGELVVESGAETTVRDVLDTLAQARLVTMGRDAVEVAHEALIREWPTLRAWLAEDLEGLRTHRHLTEAALAWEARDRDRAELYRGARLAQAAEWAGAHADELNTLEREFLTASSDEQTRREREREAQRQRELAAAQRAAEAEQQRAAERGRLLRWIGVAAALLLVATVAATLLGSRYRATAEEKAVLAEHNAAVAATAQAAEENALAAQAEESRQRSEAEAAREAEAQQRAFAEAAQRAEAEQRAAAEAAEREAAAQRDAAELKARQNLAMGLAGQAAVYQDRNSALALLLALEANAIHDTPQTKGALVSALEHSPGYVRFYGDHGDYVNGMALSPDGTLLAVTEGARVYLRDAATGGRIGEPVSGRADTAMGEVAFLAEGAVLAVLKAKDPAAPPEMRFFEVSPTDGIGEELGSVVAPGHLYLPDYWGKAATSPDGQQLAVAGCYEGFTTSGGFRYCRHGGVGLFDISGLVAGEGNAIEVATLELAGQIHDVAFSPDGKTVALGGCSGWADNGCNEGLTLLWDPVSDEVAAREAFDAVGLTDVGALAYTPDGAHLVVAGCGANGVNSTCIQARADVWALDPVESVAQLVLGEAHDMFYSAAVSADGWAVALGEFSPPYIYVWRPWEESLRPLPMVGHTSAVRDLAFSPDGQMLYSVGDDRLLGYWDLTLTGGIRSRLVREWQSVTQVTYSPEGDIVATGGMGGIRLWDATSRELVRLLEPPGPMDVRWGVAFGPDGRLVAAGGITGGDIRLWDAETGEPVGEPVVPVPGAPAWSVAFSPGGKILAASGRHPLITLWGVDSLIAGEPVSRTLLGHAPDHGIPQVVFSPDGSRLASAGNDGTARFWDVATGEQVGDALDPGGGGIRSLAYSPDGTILATAGDDTNVCLWDVATHDLIATLSGHDSATWHIAFTPDGSMLVSLDDMGFLWLWDMTDPANPGRAIAETNQGHLTWAYGLAVSPDGKTATTTAQSGEIQQWHIDPAWWRERACAIADRNLTQAEWQQYLPTEPYRETCPGVRSP